MGNPMTNSSATVPVSLPSPALFGEVCSPSLVFFSEVIESNMDQLIRMVGGQPKKLRPHCKTHKCSRIIRMLIDRGVEKHKCATLAEAAMLARAGAKDVLVSYPIVGPNWRILQALIAAYPQVVFSCLVDDPKALESLPQTGPRPHLFLDLDGGMGRTGIAWQTEDGRTRLKTLLGFLDGKGFTLAGVQLYDGHVNQESLEERLSSVKEEWTGLDQLFLEFPQLCNPGIEVVVGGSPSFMAHRHKTHPQVTHSPGTVILHDFGYGSKYKDMSCFGWGAAILIRVISKPQPGRLTLDAGHKAIAGDPPLEKRVHFPGLTDAKILLQNEEHLVVETASATQIPIGEALWAIPWHVCPTVALHEKALVYGSKGIEGWWPIDARTRFSGYESPT